MIILFDNKSHSNDFKYSPTPLIQDIKGYFENVLENKTNKKARKKTFETSTNI